MQTLDTPDTFDTRDTEILAALQLLKTVDCYVPVREGGGPENIYASLAVSVIKAVEEIKLVRARDAQDASSSREMRWQAFDARVQRDRATAEQYEDYGTLCSFEESRARTEAIKKSILDATPGGPDDFGGSDEDCFNHTRARDLLPKKDEED